MQIADSTTLQKSPKAKKIEDIVKPDATMRLHQRLFDRRRKHHIDVKEEGATSPGASLDAYLIPARYHQAPTTQKKLLASQALVTTAPVPVVRYSEITRDIPIESYLTSVSNHARSFMDRVTQRYHVFVSQHKPFYYSVGSGTASGWLTNPRSRIALAGSALALLMFFIGTPSYTPPAGPDNPVGTNNPIVIEDTSHGSNAKTAEQAAPASTESSNAKKPAPSSTTTTTVAMPPTPAAQPGDTTSIMNGITNEGGRGSGPASLYTPTTTTQTSQQNTTTPTAPTTNNLIQDIIKPTPMTIPGQDIQVDDKQILQTTDTTITIN